MPMTGLHHIGILCRDIDASIAFYRDKLGFTLDRTAQSGSQLAFLSLGDCKIELICPKEYAQRPEGVVAHVAIQCADIADVVRDLRAKGVALDADEPRHIPDLGPNSYNLFFSGPDGERLELFQD